MSQKRHKSEEIVAAEAVRSALSDKLTLSRAGAMPSVRDDQALSLPLLQNEP